MDNMTEKKDFDATSLLKDIWQTRFNIFYTMLAITIFLLFLSLALFTILPSEQVFQKAINFTFLETKKGSKLIRKYPNGIPFSMNDLISPLVLKTLYDNNHLDKKNVSLQEISSAVSVRPYAITYKETIKRYKTRLKNKRLTLAERKEITKNMEREVSFLTSNNALIQFHYTSHLGISPELGQKIVTDIPKIWSKISIEQRGVLNLPEQISHKILIDLPKLKEDDYIIMTNKMRQYISVLSNRINNLKKVNGSETVIDPKSGYTINSLQQEVDQIYSYNVPLLTSLLDSSFITKTPSITKSYIKQRIFSNKGKIKMIEDRMQSLTRIIEGDQNRGETTISNRNNTNSLQDTRVAPQINDSFLGQLTKMIQKSNNSELREKLINEKLVEQKKLASLKIKISNLEQDLKKIEFNNKDQNTENIEKEFIQKITETSNKINKLWAILNNLFEGFSQKRYSSSSSLFVNLAIEKSYIYYHFILSTKFLLSALILLILSGLFAMLISLLRRVE